MDAISGAETLHLFMQHADRYAMAGLAQGINVIHSLLLTRSSDSALVKTPTFYVFKMFLPHHRANAKWAPSTLTSENITGNGQTFPVLSAGSTVDDQGRVNISLANVDLVNTRTIKVTINSSQERVRRLDGAGHHRPGEGQLQRLRRDREGEHPDAGRFQLLDLRQDAAGHAAGEERRDAGPDAHVVNAPTRTTC